MVPTAHQGGILNRVDDVSPLEAQHPLSLACLHHTSTLCVFSPEEVSGLEIMWLLICVVQWIQ